MANDSGSGDPFKDLMDAMNKISEEMGKTGRSFRDKNPFAEFRDARAYDTDWSTMDESNYYKNAYSRWMDRFEVNFRAEEKCYRVKDNKSKIWLDVPHSAVVEEAKGAKVGDDQRTMVKKRAGKIAHALIQHKEKESKREETRIISVTYPATDRQPDFCSPSQEGPVESTSDVHMLRASAGVAGR